MNYITGANGFLGKHLVKALDDVQVIPHELIHTIKLLPFDNFFFLSSYGNIWGQDDIDEIIKANLLDLIYILSEVRKQKFKSFIFISTSSVKLEYQTPYSRMKKAAEEVLLTYLEKFRLPVCIIRPFSITGVGEQKEHLIPSLIRSCMTGELLNFVPEPTHDFIDVQDVAGALIHASEHSLRGIFEVGTGKQYTNQEVLKLVEKITKKKANINITTSLRPYDTKNWFSTNYKLRGWGWFPKKTLEQSILEMVKVYER